MGHQLLEEHQVLNRRQDVQRLFGKGSMKTHELNKEDRSSDTAESGFTVLEVAVASVIMVVGLVFLASLFTVAITQNRLIKQYTASTALAQQKMEELNAIDKNDTRLAVGGGLDSTTQQTSYWEELLVDDTGTVTTPVPTGQIANYKRYWKVENDPGLTTTRIISVRVVALQPSRGRRAEDTVLVSVRSW
jgi:type II secretory pathway pseudopilin PulG